MNNIPRRHFVFLVCFIIFGLLLYKDPFSQRTLIPNFEPFPDTFYYITSARNALEGKGLRFIREGREIRQGVPPLYSVSLMPAFLIRNDPRIFYFVNVAFSLLSFFLFYLILKHITKNLLIYGLGLFLYITNYFFYWISTLAMAENLILPLFLGGVLILISRINLLNVSLAAALSTSFYATKYAALPLTVIFPLLYFCKILFWQKRMTQKLTLGIFFILLALMIFVSFSIYEYSVARTSLLKSVVDTVSRFVTTEVRPTIPSVEQSKSTSKSVWFSSIYINKNLPEYLGALSGSSMRFLWDYTPILPRMVALPSLIFLLIGLFYKKFRSLNLALLLMLSGTVLFMSSFYTTDARYVYIAIPTLLISFILLLSFLDDYFTKKKIQNLYWIFLLVALIFYLMTNTLRLKNQIMLNLKYAETPWYYVSIVEMNNYFTKERIVNDKKPIVISAMPPYLIDYFSNGNYTLLPLSYEQEFRDSKETVWGPNDYSNLPRLYQKYLQEGYPVYVARYGLGNESYTNSDFRIITEKFKLTRVLQGCYEQCNIYRLELKE